MKSLMAILFFLLLFSCNKKQEQMGAGETNFRFSKDTVFVREKDYFNVNQTNNGLFSIFSQPAEHQLNMSYNEPSGRVRFYYRGVPLVDGQPFVVAADSSALFCAADTAGVYTADFYLTDRLGRVLQRQLVVKCMASPKPVAGLVYKPLEKSPDNFLYYFIAGSSKQPYGAIVSYHFLINGQQQITSTPYLQWYFHDRGQQEVFFHVIDDLGVSSDTLHYSILVP